MSVSGLLNIPIVFLVDNSDLAWTKESIKQLSALSFSGKIYVFFHYINADTQDDFCAEFPVVIWKEADDTMIYEQLCADGAILPSRVTFYLLPELLQEPCVVVLHQPINEPIWVKIAHQVRWWVKTRVPFIETKEFSYLDLDLLRQTGLMKQFLEKG